MTHAFLYVPSGLGGAHDGFSEGVKALMRFKRVAITDDATSKLARLAIAPAVKAADKRIVRSADGKVWLVDLGTWLQMPAESVRDAEWLIEQYRNLGVRGMARQIQGLFALIVVDHESRAVHVVSDRCGSLHVFWRQVADGHAVCTSSATLALCGAARLDAVGLHEFVATGVVYEDRSLWDGIRKIGPATILSFEDGQPHTQRYWEFADVAPETLDLGPAVEQTHHALIQILKALPETAQLVVSDLTGGYDSRFLLAGLLESGRRFDTTVSGDSNHPDVLVSGRIARELGLQHGHVISASSPAPEEFGTALRMTDGEYDAFDYARILKTHRGLAAHHGMSLNGSFGEIARGYWWELLWPKLARNEPLDVAMVARRRFAAIGYEKDVFDRCAQIDLAEHMAGVARRAVESIVGFPNTSQMDCVYYTLRMQRWQGRIASSTNQIWPAFSPIGFGQILDPILAAKASARFRSLLVRELFARFQPRLARIPLEHGYPPMPATPFNLWRFGPLLGHYGGKVAEKLAGRLGKRLSAARSDPSPLIAKMPEFAGVFGETALLDWLKAPILLDTGLFDNRLLLQFLSPSGAGGGRIDQWRRLVTVEALLRSID